MLQKYWKNFFWIQRTFQTPTAFNDLSVKENVTVGASFAGRSRILSSDKNASIFSDCKMIS